MQKNHFGGRPFCRTDPSPRRRKSRVEILLLRTFLGFEPRASPHPDNLEPQIGGLRKEGRGRRYRYRLGHLGMVKWFELGIYSGFPNSWRPPSVLYNFAIVKTCCWYRRSCYHRDGFMFELVILLRDSLCYREFYTGSLMDILRYQVNIHFHLIAKQ